jgi:hypothetical protein
LFLCNCAWKQPRRPCGAARGDALDAGVQEEQHGGSSPWGRWQGRQGRGRPGRRQRRRRHSAGAEEDEVDAEDPGLPRMRPSAERCRATRLIWWTHRLVPGRSKSVAQCGGHGVELGRAWGK